ncbi:MAG: DUF2666 family protein, partial [Candidatus Micrarchaeota archaeon]|nr:DUF2666 family protein [Candidatus Micrarchaeota archaeon]
MESVDEIVFTARYKDWAVIKKLLIEPITTPQDVAASLASIEATISRKSYDFTGINREQIEAIADRLSAGKRKSFVSLSDALLAI